MREEEGGVRFRAGTIDDAAAIADLHTRSWRANYRGSLSDAYLDGPIEGERRAFWQERLRHPRTGLWTLVADDDTQTLAGFLCLLADHDHHWGTLIDNLHVDPARVRQGVGRALMRAAAEHLLFGLPRRPIYLFVLESNTAVAGFYRHLGGEPAEHLVSTEPDGSSLPVIRYVWPSAAAFAGGTG